MLFWRVSSSFLVIACLTACGRGQATAAASAGQPTRTSPAATAVAPEKGGGRAVTGTVAETMNAGGYTYARLKTDTSDVWIAASEFSVTVGDRLTAPLEMPMENFHSKTLNRDFPIVYFVSQVAREGEALSPSQGQSAAPAMMGSHQAAPTTVEPIAPAPGGLSIADVWAKRKSLAGKPVVVRGKVVKVNNGIMDRNWLHLQDGSGSADKGTNDLTITTDAVVKIGDIVTASGVLAIEKDFGAGYLYAAILEKASVTAK